ncbi:MAG TPA: phosphoglycerate kinase [Pirellulales bacterium]|nr:phosphoglycerate kinase [Pirellulales bacterium]
MPVTVESMARWCQTMLGAEQSAPRLSLDDYLRAVPRLDSLDDVPSGTPVLVRGDLDAKPGATIGLGDVRLRSMVETLSHGRRRGWKQIIFGHVGRKPEGSLVAVGKRLSELLDCDVPLVTDWLDEGTLTVSTAAARTIADAAPRSVLLLENTRRYAIERVLWKATLADVEGLAGRLAQFANDVADKLARIYVNEALSAGSLDSSTTIVPAAMDRVALGRYVASEFDGPMRRCLATRLVVFSGLKSDKLDDLEAMIGRGAIGWVFTAGSLAMALMKAAAQLEGIEFHMGVAEDPTHQDKPYFIAPDRVDQARRMLQAGREKNIRFVLPCDFVLEDGRAAELIGPGHQQFDVGPKTSALFERQIGAFIDETRGAAAGQPAVAFHNGVFGMFEDPRFEEGTRRFVAQLKRMTDAGIEVYVGGGEGGTALERYGKPAWVTHCFTAGGTVLGALGANPVPYLQAMRMAAQR